MRLEFWCCKCEAHRHISERNIGAGNRTLCKLHYEKETEQIKAKKVKSNIKDLIKEANINKRAKEIREEQKPLTRRRIEEIKIQQQLRKEFDYD